MKTILLVLSIVGVGSLAASAQVAPGRNQRGNVPGTGANYSSGANYGGSAEYAAVSVAPRAGGAGGAYNQGNYNQGNSRNTNRQQGRNRRGAEYVAVSVAPRR